MKQIRTLFFIAGLFCIASSSFAQNKAVEDQKKAYDALAAYSPKGVAPGAGIYMKAKINGKDWEANNLFPDTDPGSNYHVNGENAGVSIAFYVPLSQLAVGYTHTFSDHFAADFSYTDAVVFYGGRAGSFTVTKVDKDGFEASFHFTAKNAGGKGGVFEITDGKLRFPLKRKK